MLTPDTTVSIALIVSLIAIVSQISTMVANHRKQSGEKEREKIDIEKNFLKTNVKLDTFGQSLNTMLRNQEKSADNLQSLSEQIIKCNERVETLFRYHKNHEERIKKLEDEVKS